MTKAWEVSATLEGDHLAKLALALKTAWAEAKAPAITDEYSTEYLAILFYRY